MKVHMPRLHHKHTHTQNIIEQESVSHLKPSSIGMFSNVNDLDKIQDTEFQRTIINLRIQRLYRRHTKTSALERINNKCLSDTQETLNIPLKEMIKTIQDLKVELKKEIEILNGVQTEIKMELKNLTNQFNLKSLGESSRDGLNKQVIKYHD